MAKMIIMYEEPKDKEGFERHYFEVHVPLGRKIPNIKSETIQRVVTTQNTSLNLYLIVELEFENMEALTKAFTSAEARAAEEDGPQLFKYLHKPPIITIVE